MKRLGVVGSLVWDEIHGWEQNSAPVQEWGGIAYALAGLDAALDDSWEIVPLIKVGDDLAEEAARFLGSLRRGAEGARCVSVPTPNNRVTLRYLSAERRCERMSGGVPGWTWPELGPMVDGLDALYVNFISGMELSLGTAEALRQGFGGPIYADLHSLLLGTSPDGVRQLQPLMAPVEWFNCFDAVQLNEDEMNQLGPDPMAVASMAFGAGVSLLNVTLGQRGVAYVARNQFNGLRRYEPLDSGWSNTSSLATELVPAPAVAAIDPTGCGDVFGATCVASLLSELPLRESIERANGAAARNATFRGATGLTNHLRGQLLAAP